MHRSCSKTTCEEAIFSGATGRSDSTDITLPLLGRASQQFLSSFSLSGNAHRSNHEVSTARYIGNSTNKRIKHEDLM
jgi:hypothetical protein